MKVGQKKTPISWWEPELVGREREFLQSVLDANYMNEGDWVERFENEIAKIAGARYGVATSNGTSALFLGLAACGIGHGDEVLVPDVTFIATASAVKLAGATPILVDVDASTLTMNLQAARKAITPRTKAIMPVHVSGRLVDRRIISQFAKETGLVVVEDSCESLLSLSSTTKMTSQIKGACFSFSSNKTISTGQGGVIVTDDEKLYWKIRELKDQGRARRGTGGDDMHPAIGFNFKMTNLQAAVGVAQLEDVTRRGEHQRNLYRWYLEELNGVQGITLLPFDLNLGETPQWVDALVDNRASLAAAFDEVGIGYRRFWHPLHSQKPYLLPDNQFPVSTVCCQKALWLPSSLNMTRAHVSQVGEVIRANLSKTRMAA